MNINPEMERLLKDGNWSAAMAHWGIPVERQRQVGTDIVRHAEARGLDPKRFRVHRRVYDGSEYDPPQYYLVNEGREGSILLQLTRDGYGVASVYVQEYAHNPASCEMAGECTCDELDPDEGYDECDSCANGSDFCRTHGTWH